MAGAYAALVSLVQLLHPDEFPRHHRYPEIELLYNITDSLRSLERIFPLPETSQLREAIYKAQDMIEYFILRESLSSEIHTGDGQSCSISSFLQELVGIIADVNPLAKEAEEIADSIFKKDSQANDWPSQISADQPHKNTKIVGREKDLRLVKREILSNESDLQVVPIKEAEEIARSLKEDFQGHDLSSQIGADLEPRFSMTNKNIVGRDKDLRLVKREILSEKSNLQVVPITGSSGIGKTALARSVYDDLEIEKEFSLRGWVTVSQDDQQRDILSKLWSSMETHNMKGQKPLKVFQSIHDARDLIFRTLYEKKYFIVVDNVRDKKVWDWLKLSFPDKRNGSRIVITTRDINVAEYCTYDERTNSIHRMEPLDDEYSWYLLCEIAFGDRSSCPPHLKDISQQISENCHGLPLSLTVVGGLLSRVEQTEEDWKWILQDTNAAAEKSDEAYLDILSLGYHNLPVQLKVCFLYMGAFPQDTVIPVSKLIMLWVAEGFLRMPSYLESTVEQVAMDHLTQLIERNLVVVHKIGSDGQIKTCGIHNSLWHFATHECEKEMFFHSRKRRVQQLSENTSSQRRISVHKNYLMCVKQVHESAQSITSARTLLYAGPYHDRPLPFSLTFDLLRVLDALAVYFLEFPNEIVKLIHLRYLSLTYNDVLPSSISKLQKLQILIVRRLPKIVFLGESFLPVEIWNMPQLRHLIFTESDFPMIPSLVQGSILLENLQTLTNVSAYSCTKEVLQNMRNLKKLGMWIEASGGAVGLHLDQLQQLESFKFTVLEPTPKLKVEFQPKLYFPKSLRKLTLSGCGLPWEDMTVIGQLPALEVLKLREMAFQGDEWCPNKNEFVELKFLLLEYLDLKRWKARHVHFPKLKQLILRHCYKLEEIPRMIANIGGLRLIEVVDCSSAAVYSAEDIVEDLESFYRYEVTIRTSLVGEDMGYPQFQYQL